MPSFEQSSSKFTLAPEEAGSTSYDKLLSIFYPNASDQSILGRTNRYHIGLKTSVSYENTLATASSGDFPKMAGCDLSTIFAPFQTAILASGGLPCFHANVTSSGSAVVTSGSQINFYDLLPFRWVPQDTGYLYDRSQVPRGSGDGLGHIISSNKYYGDINRYRNISNIRSVGMRLPMMCVGWGYSLEGYCIPSGNTVNKFKGEHDHGYNVDPNDYVAAPMDLRYDKDRHVWTTFGGTVQESQRVVYARVLSNALYGGQYYGRAYPMLTDLTIGVSGTIDIDDFFGGFSNYDEALIINLQEFGTSFWSFTAIGSNVEYRIGYVVGTAGNRVVVVLNGIQPEAC